MARTVDANRETSGASSIAVSEKGIGRVYQRALPPIIQFDPR
jgi:hypothetical protein